MTSQAECARLAALLDDQKRLERAEFKPLIARFLSAGFSLSVPEGSTNTRFVYLRAPAFDARANYADEWVHVPWYSEADREWKLVGIPIAATRNGVERDRRTEWQTYPGVGHTLSIV